jgi:sugar diacid utilization regulator
MPVEADERRLHAVVRVGRAMASAADYEQALATLIGTISEILDVETAGFMLYDPERSELVLQQPAFGVHDPEVIAAYHVALRDGGNAVRVFLSGRPYLTNDAPNDPRLITRFVNMFHARNSLTVPLTVEGQAIGVCHAINKRVGSFVDGDLELLNLIAPLLAVSVQSARLFRDVREQRRQLERAIFLQRELSRTAFDAPGMLSLADRLADLVDRPVMVLDPALHPLATSRWPAGVDPDDGWLADTHHDHWWRGRGPDEDRPALTPIAVGNHFGGYLAVLDQAQPLDLIDARALEHAATIFALGMLRERTSFEAESRAKGDLLTDLFSGAQRDQREIEQLLADLDYTMHGPWRVAQIHAAWRGAPTDADARWSEEVQAPSARLYPLLQEFCARTLGTAAVAPWRSGFLLLLPASPDETGRDLKIATELHAGARLAADRIRAGARLHLATSSPVHLAGDLAHGLRESDQALQIARTLDITDRPLVFEHLGVYRVLLGGRGSRQHLDFIHEALGPVVRYDTEHGTQLLATLQGYVDADHNAAEAARRLYVHPNTLAYRMRTIRRLLGGDPCRGDLRLQVELALKLHELSRL